MSDGISKLRSAGELSQIVREEHLEGRRVAFANGCFDLIHVGHVRYLENARALADILIVALNSDSSVRRLKGPGRPLQCAEERVEIIGSFGCVDYVTLFDDATVDALLEQIRPDVHVKGTDYATDTVPERATVLAYGGRVAIAGDAKAHSSRDVIRNILSKCKP